MEALVAGIQREVEADCAWLGPAGCASSFSLSWGDGKLRLPRVEDAIFGVNFSSPLDPDGRDDSDVAADDANESEGINGSNEDEEVADSDEEAAVSPPSIQEEDVVAMDAHVASLGDEMEKCQPPAASGNSVEATGAYTSHEISSAVQAIAPEPSDGTAAGVEPLATETRATPQAETSTVFDAETSVTALQAEKPGDLLARGTKDGQQLTGVQEILATYSREEVLLELQWARQALRDRRKVSFAAVLARSHPSW
ncbi:hypothetical protein BBJ28_00019243 [Nothophytophthora sp. Chile5]|nr:hypothetical protein BBJ28_00019243 [Nothophytophthora sp. Chile5]